MNATKTNPFNWDAYTSLRKNNNQSEESFNEQRLGICVATKAIDKYCYIGNLTYTKNVGLRGFPGSGKTWCSLYIAMYALSKGLLVLPTVF